MILFQIRHSHCQIGFATRSIKAFALASFYAPLYAAPRQLISLVDSIRVVLFLIVPVSRYGGTMFTIKTEREKACANFTIAPAGPRLAVQRQGGRLLHSHLCTNIEQVAHQRAWLLHDCPPATKLRPSKNYADARFLSWLGRIVISHRKITRLLPAPRKVVQFQLSDELTPVSSASPSRARETRCTENRKLSGPAIPPRALTPPCAGTSDDRPALPADDWTAPCTAAPVAAAAIGLVVGSFAGAGATMRSDSIARQQEQKN